MSDFAGIWRLDGRPVDEADIARLADGMEGRGIDAPRVWRSGPVALVHRQHRFTPEDAAERMPLAGRSGLVVMADAFLTARDELMAALGDAVGRDAPDGALILAAVERWGAEEAIARLYGPFALAVWDGAARRLILGRDPTGQRSLFIHRGPRLIAFATRLRPLLALPEIPRDLDEQELAHNLILNVSPYPSRTFYAAIDRLPMGHLAVVEAEVTRQRRWWSHPSTGSLRFRSDVETEEAAREVLDRVIGAHLRAEGPVTSLLTGGLDTAMVAGTAARLLAPGRLAAVTRLPDGPVFDPNPRFFSDESPRARAFAALHPGIDWHGVAADDEDWGEHDPQRWFLESGVPNRAPWSIAWFFPLYRFMHRRGGRVALSGDMGNLWFSFGGLALLPMLFRSGRWGKLLRQLRGMARHQDESVFRLLLRHVVKPYAPLPLLLRAKGLPFPPWRRFSAIHPGFAAEMRLTETVDWSECRRGVGGGARSPEQWRRWGGLGSESGGDIRGAIRAVSGIDYRIPLADRRVAEFFGALPLEQFLRNGARRSLARRLLAGAAPAETLALRDSGMQNGGWHTRISRMVPEMREEMAGLRASTLARRLVDLDRLQAVLDQWPADVEAAELRRRECFMVLQQGMAMARFLARYQDGKG